MAWSGSNWPAQTRPPPAATAQTRSGSSIRSGTAAPCGSIRVTERPSLSAVQTASPATTTFSTQAPHTEFGLGSPSSTITLTFAVFVFTAYTWFERWATTHARPAPTATPVGLGTVVVDTTLPESR